MAKYKVLKSFRDIHTKKVYEENQEVELSDERAEEVKENLKDKGNFIELIPEREESEGDQFDREAAKKRLEELGVEFKGNAKNETLKKLLEEHESDDQAEGSDEEETTEEKDEEGN